MNNPRFYNSPRNFRPRFTNHPKSRHFNPPAAPFIQRARPPFSRPPFGMTPEGVLLPSHLQAPPMFGPRGTTLPPKIMNNKMYNKNCNYPVIPQDRKYDFWCETCDRGFRSQDMLEQHKSEHQKCGIDGCSFIAHPNVVTKHIQMQHSTGLYKKIQNINTPEEIEQWIKERKKNFPTKENIEKKQAQQKECFDRGEKLQGNKSRFNNRKNNDNKANNGKPGFKDRKSRFNSRNSTPQDHKNNLIKNNFKGKKTDFPVKNLPIDKNIKVPEFKGISSLIRHDLIENDIVPSVKDDIDVEDEEWQEAVSVNDKPLGNVGVCSALNSLITAYNSSSDDENAYNSNQPKHNLSKIPKLEVVDNANEKSLPEIETHNPTGHEKELEVKLDAGENNEESDGSSPEEVKIEKSTINFPDIEKPAKVGRKRKRSRNNHSEVGKKDTKPNEATSLGNDDKMYSERKKETNLQLFKRRMPPTLLEKLLEKDIKHERNVVLQCIHYIVQNNFFDKKT